MSDAIIVGGNGSPGTVSVRGADGKPVVELLGRTDEAVIGAGQQGRPGRLTMYDGEGQQAVNLTTADAALTLGGAGVPGTVSVRGADGKPVVELLGRTDEAVIGAGQEGRPGRLSLYDGGGQEAIQLSGKDGDILLRNADCAEEFDVSPSSPGPQPGQVVVIADDGAVTPCTVAYDTRVVGIVAGAGSYAPGLVLDRRDSDRPRAVVSLMGKVACLVDADLAPVSPGDALTTAPTPGHAMVALQRDQAAGSIVAKSLGSLTSGRGLVPVVLSLG